MGCIKSNKTIKIKDIEKMKINEMEQERLISTYISSSECGDSDASIKESSRNNKNNNDNNPSNLSNEENNT